MCGYFLLAVVDLAAQMFQFLGFLFNRQTTRKRMYALIEGAQPEVLS